MIEHAVQRGVPNQGFQQSFALQAGSSRRGIKATGVPLPKGSRGLQIHDGLMSSLNRLLHERLNYCGVFVTVASLAFIARSVTASASPAFCNTKCATDMPSEIPASTSFR